MSVFQKWLVLRFDNAQHFVQNLNSNNGKKHKVFCTYSKYFNTETGKRKKPDKGAPKKRADVGRFKEPITFKQISNMLHVLYGQRPAPTFRCSDYGRQQFIDDRALESWLYIETPMFHNTNKNEWRYPRETKTLRKAAYNAYESPENIPFSWEIIADKAGGELEWLLRKLKDLGIDTKKPVMDVRKESRDLAINYLTNEELNGIKGYFKDRKMTRFFDFFFKPIKEASSILAEIKSDINSYGTSFQYNIISDITQIISLSGYVFVPINDTDIEYLRYGNGVATLLEDGVVTIYDIGYEDEIDWYLYYGLETTMRRVGDISTEKVE